MTCIALQKVERRQAFVYFLREQLGLRGTKVAAIRRRAAPLRS